MKVIQEVMFIRTEWHFGQHILEVLMKHFWIQIQTNVVRRVNMTSITIHESITIHFLDIVKLSSILSALHKLYLSSKRSIARILGIVYSRRSWTFWCSYASISCLCGRRNRRRHRTWISLGLFPRHVCQCPRLQEFLLANKTNYLTDTCPGQVTKGDFYYIFLCNAFKLIVWYSFWYNYLSTNVVMCQMFSTYWYKI